MKLLKKIVICGQRYSIFSVKKGEVKGMGRAEGMTIVSKNVIYIKERLLKNPDRFMDTLIHEILHALFDASGLGFWLKEKYQFTEEGWFKFQEKVIRFQTPALLSTLASLGFIPKGPFR